MFLMRKPAAFVALAALVAACAAPADPVAEPDPTTSTTNSTTTTISGAEATTTTEVPTLQSVPRSDAELLTLAKAARADLATHLGIAEDEIAITSAATVVWNDGSVGCPQPGMSYTQALVDGARFTLIYDDATYSYHLGGDGLFLCEAPADDSFTVSKDYSGDLEMTPPPGFDT